MGIQPSSDRTLSQLAAPSLPRGADYLWEPFLMLAGREVQNFTPSKFQIMGLEALPEENHIAEGVEIIEAANGPGKLEGGAIDVPEGALIITFRVKRHEFGSVIGTGEYRIGEDGVRVPQKLIFWIFDPMVGHCPSLGWRHPVLPDPESAADRVARFGAPFQGVDRLIYGYQLDLDTVRLWVRSYYPEIDAGNPDFLLARLDDACVYRRGKSVFSGREAVEQLFRSGRPAGIRHHDISDQATYSEEHFHVFVEGSYSVPGAEPGPFADHWKISKGGKIVERKSSFFVGEAAVTKLAAQS